METQSRAWAATLWVARAGCALAMVGLVMELVSGWGYRQGLWGLRVALRDLFGYGGLVTWAGVGLSLLALVLAVAAKARGATLGAIGVLVGLVPGILFYRQFRLARSVPPINDISTDLQSPPAYVTAATHEFWKGKDMGYPAGFADSVRRGYPDLGSLVLPLPAGKVYGLAHKTALGVPRWEVTGTDSTAGRIEATATTRWFGFNDDVVIRIAPRGTDSAAVDMRSKSRVGQSDVGANAARIRDYFAALRRAAGP